MKWIGMQVVAPEYLESPAPEMISRYLLNNRADTLESALNIYHTERYRQASLSMQAQQIQEIRASISQQQFALWAQEEQHQQRMQALYNTTQGLRDELSGLRSAAEDIAFYEGLRFWLDW